VLFPAGSTSTTPYRFDCENFIPGGLKISCVHGETTAFIDSQTHSRRSRSPEPRELRTGRFDVTINAAPKSHFRCTVGDSTCGPAGLSSRRAHEVSAVCLAEPTRSRSLLPFQKRLCSVDVRIPGPNIVRGKGVNIHAIDLGALAYPEVRERLNFARSLPRPVATA